MVETFQGPWYYSAPKDSSGAGTQIDLLIDRKDLTINLSEMKFPEAEFAIDADYAKELRQKAMFLNPYPKQRRTFLLLWSLPLELRATPMLMT